jgi:hypothetical protein
MKEQQLKIKTQLKESLPYGSNAEIKRRIAKLKSRTLSSSMIGNILNPEKEAWDNDVISTALDIAKEHAEGFQQIEEKATNLLSL